MKNEISFKKTLAVIAGTVLTLSSTPVTAIAEDTTTSSTTETTSATDTATVTETTATTASADSMPSESENPVEEKDIEWFKAELDEYDDSLSLISYESSPESSGKSKTPTPVELNVTGGYVGDIPWLESEPVIESVPGQFAVVTYGWGHGVGMSQNGANFYAMYSGWTYQDILFHYYPDTYLMNTGLAEEEEITVNGVSGDVLSMVSQIVYNEVGGTMSYEAIKAQAVAVYSYCKYNGNDAKDLRCKPNPPSVVVDAVSEVLGQALYYNDYYALTMFSASSGGITANCSEVFYSDLPYLRSVSSDYDPAYDPHYGTVTYIDDFQLRNMIESAYNIELSDNPQNWVKPQYSESTGYVTYVNIDDQLTVKGYDFKLAIGLKSSKFNVFYTPRLDGEEIPEGTSVPIVVDPDYTQTPAVYYPNSYPTDIGTVTEPEPEEPTDEPDFTEPDYTEPDWTEPEWYDEPVWTEPEYYDEPLW
ncbi:MAG: sporulation protein [Ruminococcus flavefaciens]|nr:sporulation protein [Ruminococcus flavefaciens]MCM1229062.1 sporulation protein [Ruminococcus flavefaciens]